MNGQHKLETSLDNLAHIANMSQLSNPNDPSDVSPSGSVDGKNRIKRMACVECRQQKSKCDAHERAPLPCTRCTKRKLRCDLNSDYKRTYKRARIAQIEKEFNELRQSLSNGVAPSGTQSPLLPSIRNNLLDPDGFNGTAEAYQSPITMSPFQDLRAMNVPQPLQMAPEPQLAVVPPVAAPVMENAPSIVRQVPRTKINLFSKNTQNELSPNTKPDIPEEALVCEPKTIGDITLTSQQIRALFLEFVEHYHPILPVVECTKGGPERIYRLCPALFWVIMFISLRRFNEDSGSELLLKLGPIIKNILAEIAISPITRYNPTEMDQPVLNVSSVYSVQAFLLYTFWPPITSSLSADSSWNTIGVAIFQAIRLGLHSPGQSTDFSSGKVDSKQVAILTEHIKTWISCNIVSQTIATSFGFPAFSQFDSSSLNACRPESEIAIPQSIKLMMEIAHFEDQVAKTLNSNLMDPYGLVDATERLPLLKVLLSQLDELEIRFINSPAMDDFRRFQLLAARVHLLTYYFLDTSRIATFELKRGLTKAYNSALALINHSQVAQNKNKQFVRYLPGVYVLNIWQAAFIVGKLAHSSLKDCIDIGSGKELYQIAVNLTARASILKHDMAYRSSGIMRNMWQLFRTLDSKNLTDYNITIRTRMAASVFFDCLFVLRERVGMIKLINSGSENAIDDEESQSYDEDEDEDEVEQHIDDDHEHAMASDQEAKHELGSTPGSTKSSTSSSKIRKARTLSNTMNPESSARKIIRTIPLDPQPISINTNKERSSSIFQLVNVKASKDGHEHQQGSQKRRKNPITPASQASSSTTPTTTFVKPVTNGATPRFDSIPPHTTVNTVTQQREVVQPDQIDYNEVFESPVQPIESFELESWELNGDMLWKDVDSVMNDFGFHPQNM